MSDRPVPAHLDADAKAFTGARFDVYAVELDRRGGGTMRREVVVTMDAVVILPLLPPGEGEDDPGVVLIRNRRFAVDQTLWELPAGTLEPGEDPAEAAGRELIEETGYRAETIEPVTAFYPTPGFCTERMHAYRARGLTHVGQDLDETEQIEVRVTPWREALAMARDGRIMDGKTLALLLHHAVFTGG